MLKATRSCGVLAVIAAALAAVAPACALDVLQAKGSAFLVNGQAVKPARYRGGLQAFARYAELFVLPQALDGERHLVLVRRPTRPLSMHRCGAGFEDYLALVRSHAGEIFLLDKIPLQSCENSVDLAQPDASRPVEIISAIKVDGDVLSFSTVAPTSAGDVATPEEHRYLVTGSHFVKQ